jgi:hypothetical protein
VFAGDNLNLLDPGTGNTGGIYLGTTSTSDPTAAIEASWGGATNPQLHMGITRATGGSKTRYSAFWNDSSLRMYTSDNERMRVTSAGNVGIGTTTPATPLDVNGDVTITDKIIHSGDTNTAIRFPAADTVTVETNGNEMLRVGTTSVELRSNLVLRPSPGDEGGQINILNPDNLTAGLIIDVSSLTNEGRVFSNANDSILTLGQIVGTGGVVKVSTASSERMRINSSGNVGINESAPDYRLDVNGTFGFTPGASVTPVDNGDVVFELTNNTTLTVKAKGSDGVVRSGTITLA